MSTAEDHGLDPVAFEKARTHFVNASARERRSDVLAQMIIIYMENADEATTGHGN